MTVTEFLKSHVPFLAGITDEQAADLAKASEQVTYKQAQTIIFRGVTVEGLHVVAVGKVTVHAKMGREVQRVAELGPGDVFGEISMIEGSVAGATIKAALDDTLVFIIPQEAFLRVIRSDKALEGRVMSVIAERKKAIAPPPPKKT